MERIKVPDEALEESWVWESAEAASSLFLHNRSHQLASLEHWEVEQLTPGPVQWEIQRGPKEPREMTFLAFPWFSLIVFKYKGEYSPGDISIGEKVSGCQPGEEVKPYGTKLSGAVDIPEGCNAIQRDLEQLKKCARGNLMRFNKTKGKVLHLGQSNPWYQYRHGDEGIESSSAEKHSGVLVDEEARHDPAALAV
ncbi:hypothetical protein WISP_49120 [Willisornis vidua]|uniref:Uncharacterized protein n=1 Tax=Willisornis vidua TaxID=1566151 RepID=A0ABQ9DE82_9PASS|nr:hypothetical protein WISP_49120 [Willisornis vidua]